MSQESLALVERDEGGVDRAFRADVLPWWQVNEFQYDAFMVRTRGRG